MEYIKNLFLFLRQRLILFFGRWETKLPDVIDDLHFLHADLHISLGFYYKKEYWQYNKDKLIHTEEGMKGLSASRVIDVIGWKIAH